MKFIVDIDGTICTGGDFKIEKAEPIPDRIAKVNSLYDDGHTIVYFTARGMGRFNEDVDEAATAFYDITEAQLQRWGAKYHDLIFGKPSADFYIDDKGVNDAQFFGPK